MNLVGRLQEYWKYRSERDSLPITCDLALEFNEKDTRILIGNRHEGEGNCRSEERVRGASSMSIDH